MLISIWRMEVDLQATHRELHRLDYCIKIFLYSKNHFVLNFICNYLIHTEIVVATQKLDHLKRILIQFTQFASKCGLELIYTQIQTLVSSTCLTN